MTTTDIAKVAFIAVLFVVLFLPLAWAMATAEPPYNPHSPYWQRKNRGKRR